MSVCDKTFNIMTNSASPYTEDIVAIQPMTEIPLAEAKLFDCDKDALRNPRQTKGLEYRATTDKASDCCCEGSCEPEKD